MRRRFVKSVVKSNGPTVELPLILMDLSVLGVRNEWCSGEMRRYHSEGRSRRGLTGAQLTLRHESVGSKQD